MTEKIKALYRRAINDTEFLAAIKSADGDEKPAIWRDRVYSRYGRGGIDASDETSNKLQVTMPTPNELKKSR